jgi:threonine/homoserine/homoserine lactone efflux protein
MPSLDTSLSFFGISLLLAFMPGPDNMVVLVQSAALGRKAGMLLVLGLCSGLVIHTAAVVLGLAAVFAASAVAFGVVKWIGAGYLLFLAWQALRSSDEPHVTASGISPRPATLYFRGVAMNLTNPKVVLFFLGFLPQFVQAGHGPVALQLAWFGGLFMLAALLAFGLINYFAAFLGRYLRRSAHAHKYLNRIAALVFSGIALRLALSKN